MYGKNSGVLNASGPTWKEQRRFVVNTLRDFGMGRNAMESKIVNSVITMFEQIDGSLKGSNDTLNMHWPLQVSWEWRRTGVSRKYAPPPLLSHFARKLVTNKHVKK